MTPVLIAVLIAVLALSPALAAPPAGTANVSTARAMGCLIEPDQVAEVGSQVVGVVDRIEVERGATVRAGQPLLRLRADVERANVGTAKTRALVDADVEAAKANLELAEQKVKRAESLEAQGFVSAQATEQAQADAEVARQRLRQTRAQQRISREEYRVASAQLALRTVYSPFSGVVVERYVNVGERVEERPLMRVAVINLLRVELMVPTAMYGTLALGDRVSIRPELPGAAPLIATVSHVDKVLDAASNSFRVRLSLPNPQLLLPAGLRCKADLPTAATASASTGIVAGAVPGKPPSP
jgi:RND family efflux transporter MFP subunit